MVGLSDKQHEVLEQVRDLLTEHFDAHLIVVNAQDVNDDGEEVQEYLFSGGRAAALGMAEMTSAAIMDKYLSGEIEEEQEEN